MNKAKSLLDAKWKGPYVFDVFSFYIHIHIYVPIHVHFQSLKTVRLLKTQIWSDIIAQWESALPNLDLPKIEARSVVSA